MSNCDKLIGRVKDNKLKGYLDYNITNSGTTTTNLGPKMITENGSYNPLSDDLDGYNLVTVEVIPKLEDLEVTPTKQIQKFNSELDGYREVIVNDIPKEYIIPQGNIEITENGNWNVRPFASVDVNVPEKILGTKEIVENGIYNASDDNLDGYSSVEVNVSTGSGDISEYFNNTVDEGGTFSSPIWSKIIKKIPSTIQVNISSLKYCFSCYPDITLPKIIKPNSITFNNMSYMFYYCNVNDVINIREIIGNIDTSNVTDMSYMFYYCKTKNINFQNIDTSNVSNMQCLFDNCVNLESIDFDENFDTSNVTNMYRTFYYCSKLKAIPKLNASKVISVNGFCYAPNSLETFGGLENLGAAYLTTAAANYNNYTFSVSSSVSNGLTHESLMNIINGLYDIASKGCNAQSLELGKTNLAKLSEEEIAIATEKGWTVS